ncbi:protocadherin-1-like [Mizuhopecten yessoensis]|uniref:Protocadherin-1 n=1 Tax=Mizuhopecten yessoensis TaxID=6573 RepID=A0A210PLG8_MIZYE|nr:protocadherin-1-like [Mizuhopecten yessoensis]OWF37314.1 Protocadherin-1 [Mizuhopecten yessoensis]
MAKRLIFLYIALCCTGIIASATTIKIAYSTTEESGSDDVIGNTAVDAGLASLVADSEELQALKFSLLKQGNPDASRFYVDENTGDLLTSESLDRDVICAFVTTGSDCYLNMFVIARTSTGSFFKIEIQILVIDINDNTPTFDEDVVSLSVPEGTELGTSFDLDGAQDPDSGVYTIQSYSINSNDSPFVAKADQFPNGQSMLLLIVNGTLDREKTESYMLHILAYDGGQPPNTGSIMVNVTVTDVNEFRPNFTQSVYNVTIMEDHDVDGSITTVQAIDPDGGVNGEVLYSLSPLQSAAVLERFRIDSTKGVITLRTSLMEDSNEGYRVIVEAYDRAKQPMMSQAQVFIKVIDNHNNVPTIRVDLLSNTNFAEISEHASQGAAVAHVAVTDKDTGANGLVVCNVLNDNFRIQKYEDMEYKIVVYTSLNREVAEEYNVTVKCDDAGTPPKHVTSTFRVLVLDENDNAPRFTQQKYFAHIRENNVIGQKAVTVTATDIDKGTNALVTYALAPTNNGRFQVQPETGQISVNIQLNREVQGQYSFQIMAVDKGTPALTGTAVVYVIVEDENDNSPTFGENHFHFYVQENLAVNTSIGIVSAYDIDLGDNGVIEYALSSLTEVPTPFWLMENGSIMTSAVLDREVVERYDLTMTALDRGDPPREGSAIITVHVIDDNDNGPIIMFPSETNSSVSIPYETPQNRVISTIDAYDKDSGLNSKLSFFTRDLNISEYFLLNSFSGEIYLIKRLSPSDIGMYSFEVLVQDGGMFPLYATRTMTITITDSLTSESFPRYVTIAICISVITLFLAVLLFFAIYLVRRNDMRKPGSFDKQVDDSFSDKTRQDEAEAGFGDLTLDRNCNVYTQQTFSVIGIPRRPPIDRSISLQVPIEHDTPNSIHPSDDPVWTPPGGEINDDERHHNQLINLQFQQSLLRIKSCKRSNSSVTI